MVSGDDGQPDDVEQVDTDDAEPAEVDSEDGPPGRTKIRQRVAGTRPPTTLTAWARSSGEH